MLRMIHTYIEAMIKLFQCFYFSYSYKLPFQNFNMGSLFTVNGPFFLLKGMLYVTPAFDEMSSLSIFFSFQPEASLLGFSFNLMRGISPIIYLLIFALTT